MRTKRTLILKSAVIAIASVAGLAFGVSQTVEELPRRPMTLKEFRFLMDEPHTNALIKQITCIYQQPPVSDDVPYLIVEMRSPRVDCVVSVDQLAGLYEQPDPGRWRPGDRLSRLLYAVLGECAYEGIDFRVKEQRMPNFAFAYKYYVRDGKRTKKYWDGLDFMASLTARAFPKSPPRELHYTDKQCAGAGIKRNPRYGKGRDSARPVQQSVAPAPVADSVKPDSIPIPPVQ